MIVPGDTLENPVTGKRPGDVVEVAPGVAHTFANAGPDEAGVRVEVRPALAM
jgi:quercetin dioxygenase-like cupin family protein